MTDSEIKNSIIDIGRRLHDGGYVASNDGNISVRGGDGGIWMTPTGVSKGDMTPDMLIKVDLDGRMLEGNRRPSTESAMHLRLYKENKNIMAAVHAPPTAATSFAIAGIPLDRPIYPEAAVNLGTVPVAPYAQPGTQEVPDSIAPFCHSHVAVLLGFHGALTWGANLTEAWYRMEALENYAKITLNVCYLMRSDAVLTREQLERCTGGLTPADRLNGRIG